MKTESIPAQDNNVTQDQLYDQRYQHGYMDDWPTRKKERVFELVRSLPLPARGAALDYGCGTGVFTEVLKRALPQWDVYGTDVSKVALTKAGDRTRNNRVGCTYIGLDGLQDLSFDFILTHHVLEHVEDLEAAWSNICGQMKEDGRALHILPCGNSDSFEHRICSLRTEGFQANGRFFFEEPGHLRRLDTEQMRNLGEKHNLSLEQEFYANHYFGAMEWMTTDARYPWSILDPKRALDKEARGELKRMRRQLTLLSLLRIPARLSEFRLRPGSGIKHKLVVSAGYLAYPLSLVMKADAAVTQKADNEWRTRRHVLSGSEMYLYFAGRQD